VAFTAYHHAYACGDPPATIDAAFAVAKMYQVSTRILQVAGDWGIVSRLSFNLSCRHLNASYQARMLVDFTSICVANGMACNTDIPRRTSSSKRHVAF